MLILAILFTFIALILAFCAVTVVLAMLRRRERRRRSSILPDIISTEEQKRKLKTLFVLMPEEPFAPSRLRFGQNSCTICQESYVFGCNVRVVPECLHAFHSTCIE